MDALKDLQSEIVHSKASQSYDEDWLDDWLQRLLSVLADLPDWETYHDDSLPADIASAKEAAVTKPNDDCHQEESLVVTIAGQALENAGPYQQVSASTSEINQTWRKGWELLASEILNERRVDDHDEEGSSSLVTFFQPTRIHATATMSSLSSSSNTRTYATTCLLLSCHAMKRVDSCAVIRRKRWHSIILETISAFQRGILVNGSPLLRDHVKNAHGLFCRYIMPAMDHVLNVLDRATTPTSDEDRKDETRRFATVFRAATIHCIATLVLLWHDQQHRHHHAGQYEQSFVTENWNVVMRIAPTNPIEWLAMHYWRQHHRERILNHCHNDNAEKSDEDYRYHQTVHLTRLTTVPDATSDDERSVEKELVDTFVGVETIWPVLGVARLVTSVVGLADRPCVWSPLYQWYLLLSPLVTRMAAELEFGLSTIGSANSSDSQTACAMLVGLLEQIPDHALTCPRQGQTPNDPFPVFQWLVNAMVVASTSTTMLSGDNNARPATSYYAIMKVLVQRYHPESQLYIITKQLYERCPYPAIRPKIVDLLRRYGQWPSKVLHECVWAFVETAIAQSGNEEETQIALLSLFEVAAPGDFRQRLERIEKSLETIERPLLAFTMDRIKGRLASV